MLKYSLTNKKIDNEYKEIAFSEIRKEGSNYSIKTVDKHYMKNDDVVFFYGFKSKQNSSFSNEYKIKYIDDKTFSITVEDRFVINQKSIILNDNNAVLYFDNFHFFTESTSTYVLYMYNLFAGVSEDSKYEFALNVRYDTDKSLIINFSENNNVFNDWSDLKSNFHYYVFERDNLVMPTDYETVSFSKMNYMFNLTFPIDENFRTDVFKNEFIVNNFIEEEKIKSINRIVDMEKDIYYPSYFDLDGSIKMVDRITFNLHFRERSGDSWLVSNDKFWNGTKSNDGVADGIDENYKTFDNVDSKSDLLTYLGFTDSDVRYQKNKLKKSFLRLLFYDSDNQANQNLIYSSTIFLDTGVLFGKYCRHITDSPYVSVYNSGETIEKLNGIRVNREPTNELVSKYYDLKDENKEEFRLSSQFNIYDKYTNTNSSDGFYLYLFKENDPKITGREMYLKIEFNHAGYGRTLPFMYPTNEDNEPLSYSEILNKWNEFKNSDGEVVGFNLNTYYNYSYIKLICKYDKKLNKHIYYLKTQTKDNINIENNQMIINLYEAKLG